MQVVSQTAQGAYNATCAYLVLNRTEETGLLLGGLTTRVENSENLARGEAMTSAAAKVAQSPEHNAHLHAGGGLVAKRGSETSRAEKAWGPGGGGQQAPSYMRLSEAETEHGHGLK